MSRVQPELARGDGFDGEFDRFLRDSPFEFDCTAGAVQKMRYVGQTVVSSGTTIVQTRIHEIVSSIPAKTNEP